MAEEFQTPLPTFESKPVGKPDGKPASLALPPAADPATPAAGPEDALVQMIQQLRAAGHEEQARAAEARLAAIKASMAGQ